MNRYFLFAGHNYYPQGGWEDFKGSFSTVNEAHGYELELYKISIVEASGCGWWWHIVDSTRLSIIEEGRKNTKLAAGGKS